MYKRNRRGYKRSRRGYREALIREDNKRSVYKRSRRGYREALIREDNESDCTWSVEYVPALRDVSLGCRGVEGSRTVLALHPIHGIGVMKPTPYK